MKLTEMEGIASTYLDRLESVGLDSVEALLAACFSVAARAELAERTGISVDLLLGWAERAELACLNGLSDEFADLLEAAGVGGLRQLAEFDKKELRKLLADTNETEQIVRDLPLARQVADWIAQAKAIEPILQY